MMKGEYEEICKKICSESATIDHGTDHESGNNCDICRGTVFYLRVVHSQAILFLKSMSERSGSDRERL